MYAFGQTFQRYKAPKDTLFSSKYLKYDKEISITLPREYQQNLPNTFPLIVVFDSQNKMSYNYILQTIDYLTSNEQMPASIVVGIKSAQNKRYRETLLKISDTTAFGEENEQFIFDELMPFLKLNYKTNEFKTLIGHSRYGFFTTYLMTKRPNEINAVVALSPFFDQKNVNLVDSVKNNLINKKLPQQLYYRFCVGNDFPNDFKAMQSMLQSENNNLNLNKNYNKKFSIKGDNFPQAQHTATPGIMIGQALYEIFEFWKEQQNKYASKQKKTLESFDALNLNVEQHYGTSFPFGMSVMNSEGWYFFNEKKYEKAIEIWKLTSEIYPNFSEIHLQIAKAQKILKITFEKSLKDFELNLSKSTFYTIVEKQELLLELEEFRKSK